MRRVVNVIYRIFCVPLILVALNISATSCSGKNIPIGSLEATAPLNCFRSSSFYKSGEQFNPQVISISEINQNKYLVTFRAGGMTIEHESDPVEYDPTTGREKRYRIQQYFPPFTRTMEVRLNPCIVKGE